LPRSLRGTISTATDSAAPIVEASEEAGTAMIEPVNRPFSTVEIVTQTYLVTARCGGLTEYTRLVDLLNNPDVTHLQLFDPKVKGLGGSGEIAAPGSYLFLDKMRIVFARTLETLEEVERRRRTREIDRVQKDRHDVIVFAAPFRIMGTVYVVRDADPLIALPRLFHNFLALTGAKVIHENDESLSWDNDFLVVNGRHIEMICSATSQTVHSRELDTGNAA
jgi:hypothetical protein